MATSKRPAPTPGTTPAEPLEAVSTFELTLARNLRQPTSCGKDYIRKLLDDPSPKAEAELAKWIADSGGRGIRENESGLTAQLLAESRISELRRRAVEAAASNPYTPPAQYSPELRRILTEALGRPY